MFNFLLSHLPLTVIFKIASIFLMFQSDGTSALVFHDADEIFVWMIVALILIMLILTFAGMWKVFTKAGEDGWASITPVYSLMVLLRVARKPGWWLLLLIIPFVDFIFGIIVSIEIAKNFGKGAGFGLGLAFLPFIFYPILGFGSAQYMPYGNQYPPPGYGR